MTRNLFTGIQVVFEGKLIDNTELNKHLKALGAPVIAEDKVSSVTVVEEELHGWLEYYGAKWEREHTFLSDGMVTMYISGKVPGIFKNQFEVMKEKGQIVSYAFGSMKTDATFHPFK